jgi:hypothetical protein
MGFRKKTLMSRLDNRLLTAFGSLSWLTILQTPGSDFQALSNFALSNIALMRSVRLTFILFPH